MDIKFQQPLYLLFLIPALLMVVWWFRTQTRVKGKKRLLIAMIRFMLFLSIILSLANPELLFPLKGDTVIFVLDQSASIKNNPKGVQFIREAIKEKDHNDRYGIITVGANAQIEQPLTNRDELVTLGKVSNQNATNLAGGIRLASSVIPNLSNGRIVVITDGIETLGNSLNEVKFAKERGISVDFYSLEQEASNEVLVSSLHLPNDLRVNEEFIGTVEVESTVTTNGVLRFYEGNNEIGTQGIKIEKGKNKFVFKQIIAEEGFHKYRVELTADVDSLKVNNHAYAFTQVNGRPKILLIEGHQGAATNLLSVLNATEVLVDVREPHLLPKELEDYKQYSTIILADTQATDFSDVDMERIRTSVRDIGIGLIMTGGGDSYGLGGWFKTPIEEALPVYMDIRGKENLPSLGLMLVIDKSGSMSADATGFSKMELAKEAALRATDMLNENDQVGVVAFDNMPWLVVEPKPTTKLTEIQNKISGIYADGGTDIFPALAMAYEEIEKIDTQRKHIILLTDGQSGRESDYEGLLEEMKQKNITVSTVAIGDDSDTNLLEYIAGLGNGRYYFSNDPSTLPKIFSKETALASKTYIVNTPHIPDKKAIGQFSALNESLPMLHSYIATTAKQTAQTNLLSLDQDPILASWQYGLGRSVAWTSDLEGKWSSNWVIWSKYSQLWNQIIGWTFPQVTQGEWKVETKLNGANGEITVEMPSGNLPTQMEAIIVNEKMESSRIQLKPIAPKKLQGSFIVNDEGTYLIQIINKAGDKVISSQTTGLNVAYSPEFSSLDSGKGRIIEILGQSDGNFVNNPNEVFRNDVISYEHQPIGNILLMLAAILWPIDIGIRRINLQYSWFETIKKRLKISKEKIRNEQIDTFDGLLKKKEQKTLIKNNDESKKLRNTSPNLLAKTEKKEQKSQTIKPNGEDPFHRLIKAKNKK